MKQNIKITIVSLLLILCATWYLTPFTEYNTSREKKEYVSINEVDNLNLINKDSSVNYYRKKKVSWTSKKSYIPFVRIKVNKKVEYAPGIYHIQ